MTFGHPELLSLLWIIPILAFISTVGFAMKKKQLKRFISQTMWQHIIPSLSPTRRFWKRASLIIAVALLAVSIARPQWGIKFEKIERKGLDIFIALDTSQSMSAQDISPSRFTRQKQEVLSLIEELKGDRVGLIAFSGDAFIQSPLTLDYDAAKLFLSQISLGMLPKPGTNISEAISIALSSFLKQNKRKKILVLFSDGETFGPNTEKLTKKANKQGVIIFTVGVGSGDGEPIPIANEDGQITGYKKDKQGTVVLSKLNADKLKQIAVQTDGLYFHSDEQTLAVTELYKAISNIEKADIESDMFKTYEDQYQWFLILVLGLLMFDLVFFERREKREWKGRI